MVKRSLSGVVGGASGPKQRCLVWSPEGRRARGVRAPRALSDRFCRCQGLASDHAAPLQGHRPVGLVEGLDDAAAVEPACDVLVVADPGWANAEWHRQLWRRRALALGVVAGEPVVQPPPCECPVVTRCQRHLEEALGPRRGRVVSMLRIVAESETVRSAAIGVPRTSSLWLSVRMRATTASSVGPRPGSLSRWISSSSSSPTRLTTPCASRRKRVNESHLDVHRHRTEDSGTG